MRSEWEGKHWKVCQSVTVVCVSVFCETICLYSFFPYEYTHTHRTTITTKQSASYHHHHHHHNRNLETQSVEHLLSTARRQSPRQMSSHVAGKGRRSQSSKPARTHMPPPSPSLVFSSQAHIATLQYLIKHVSSPDTPLPSEPVPSRVRRSCVFIRLLGSEPSPRRRKKECWGLAEGQKAGLTSTFSSQYEWRGVRGPGQVKSQLSRQQPTSHGSVSTS